MIISIIIPIYNKIEITSDCFYLNINHASEPQQWIFIDNNSDEATKSGLKKMQLYGEQAGHEIIIVEEQTNTGVAKAWNKGLTYVKTEYVCILNNDCVLMPGWDKECIEVIKNNLYDIFTPLILEPNMFNPIYSQKDFLEGKKNWLYFKKKNNNKVRKGVFGGVVFFGTLESFLKVGLFDEKFWLSMEDIEYLVRAIKRGLKIGTTGSIVGYHHVGQTRKEAKFDENKNQDYFKQKWGWNYHLNEISFLNKFKRSINKKIMKHLNIMGPFVQRIPTL